MDNFIFKFSMFLYYYFSGNFFFKKKLLYPFSDLWCTPALFINQIHDNGTVLSLKILSIKQTYVENSIRFHTFLFVKRDATWRVNYFSFFLNERLFEIKPTSYSGYESLVQQDDSFQLYQQKLYVWLSINNNIKL